MPISQENRLSRGLAGGAAKGLGMAALLMLLQACAAQPPAPPPAAIQPAPPPAAAAPALDGRLLVDAHEYPWSAIGRLNLAGRGFCNGILVGAQQVLTQARCLYAGREGRWWQPQELHFIAAYQKDEFLADSKVSSFTVAPGFNPAGGSSLANITNNWAVVILNEPIGHRTGWLGVEWDNNRLKAAADRNQATYLRAGYRADWPHAISIYFGCAEGRSDLAGLCDATPMEQALPTFVLDENELRVLGDFYLRSAAQGGTLARLTSGTISDNRLGRATPPAASSPVRARPSVSIGLVLRGLGYDVDGAGLDRAIASYLSDQGRTPRGGGDVATLSDLLVSARNSGSR
ncbi:MAG: hypothetical protein RH942_03480 [Kiloniellaceae bacterium]